MTVEWKQCLHLYNSPKHCITDTLQFWHIFSFITNTPVGDKSLCCIEGGGFFFAVLCEIDWCAEHSSVQFKQCAVTEFLTTVSTTPNEIHRPMQVLYGGNCVDMSTVCHWPTDAKRWWSWKSLVCIDSWWITIYIKYKILVCMMEFDDM